MTRRAPWLWCAVIPLNLVRCHIAAHNHTKLNYVNPINDGFPLRVDLILVLMGLSEPELKRMEIVMEVFTVLNWTASPSVCNNSRNRIKDLHISEYFKGVEVIIPPDKVQNFWTPDLFFVEASEVKMPSVVNPTVSLSLIQYYTPQGNETECGFALKQRHIMKIRCPMNFVWFPVDLQTCTINIRSFGHDVDELLLNWRGQQENQPPPIDVFTIDPTLKSLQYDIEYDYFVHSDVHWSQDPQDVSSGHKGVKIVVKFYRQFLYQFMNTYVTSFGNVLTAFAASWMSLRSSGDRITVTVNTLLALYTQMTTTRSALPFTSFLTACDIYLFMCMFSVFANVIESSVIQRINKEEQVNSLTRERLIRRPIKRSAYKRNGLNYRDIAPRQTSTKQSHWQPSRAEMAIDPILPQSFKIAGQLEKRPNMWSSLFQPPPYKSRAQHIDNLTKYTLIALFIIFSIVYFSIILFCRP